MVKKTVAVLFGGCSPEHEVSKLSAATVVANIPLELYDIIPVYITNEGEWLLYDGCLDNFKNIRWDRYATPAIISPDRNHKGLLRIVGDKVKNIPIDVVFPVLHGENGEDGTVQGLFELAGIPYVGCGVRASAVAMDKAFTKVLVEKLGINQAGYLTFNVEDLSEATEAFKTIRQKIGYPCFVKPANSGSSIGISKASNKKELEAAIALALNFDNKIIVEKEVKGRELECAVLGSGGSDTEASVVGEILTSGDLYDYESKYLNDKATVICHADLPEEISNEIRESAIKIFKAMDCYGLARVDFFVEAETNKVFFNEINTMPGFTSISLYPRMWGETGLQLPELIDRLIKLSIQ